MNLLFPSNEKNWTVTNTPVPNLSEEDLNTILTALKMNADPSVPLEDKMIELAVQEFAKGAATTSNAKFRTSSPKSAAAAWSTTCPCAARMLMSGIIYGMGVLKGPFIRMQMQHSWVHDPVAGTITPQTTNAFRPQFGICPDLGLLPGHERQVPARWMASSSV